MRHYERSVLINAPVETVFAFHERPDALELLTPPTPPVRVLRREGGLQVGAIVELLVPLGPFHKRWLARHIAYEKNRLFVDTQVSGPFAHWTHRHLFAPNGTGTLLTDSIEFELPLAPLSEWLGGWVVRRQLDSMFRYRHEVTRRYCESLG
ncbi:MAG: SRPBCC family protein [Bryobacteraceae bacterium]